MSHAMERSQGWLLLLLLVLGCGTPETRYLTLQPRPAAIEAQSYNLHDPFPDEEAGPKTGTRPRVFLEPRTDTRKNLDLRFIKAAYGFPQQSQPQYVYGDPYLPPGATPYPVQPIWRSPPATAPVAVVPTWQPQ